MVYPLYLVYLMSSLTTVYYLLLQDQVTTSTPMDNSHGNQSANYYKCEALINETSRLLEKKNITKTCSLLRTSSCGFLMERMELYAMPETVFSRSSSCHSLEFPEQTAGFDAEEEEYPLSFSIMSHG